MSTNVLSTKVLKHLDKEFEAAFGCDPKAIALEQAKALFGEADTLRKAARDLDKGLEPVRKDLDSEAAAKSKALQALKDIESQKDAARREFLLRHDVELKADRLNKSDGSGYIAKIKWINGKVHEIFVSEIQRVETEMNGAIAALEDTHARLTQDTAKINGWMKAAYEKDREAFALLAEVGVTATRKEVMK
jgi:hypothetical protein